MKGRLVVIAHKFCSEHLSDLNLDQNEFLNKVDDLILNIESEEEKLMLLNEVIRIGKLYYCSCSTNIQSWSHAGIWSAN